MKKLIRLLFKIPATPFVVIFLTMVFAVFNIVRFFEWVYEAGENDKRATYDTIQYSIQRLKVWFTTV